MTTNRFSWIQNKMRADSSAFNLSAFRFFFCFFAASSYIWSFHEADFASSAAIVGPTISRIYSLDIFGLSLFKVLVVGAILSLFLAALGVGRKIFVYLSFACFVLFEAPISVQVNPYTTNVIFFVLLLLCLSPTVAFYSASELLRGPNPNKEGREDYTMFSVMCLAPFVFFNAFVSKVLNGGWSWWSGETFQAFLLGRQLITDSEVTLRIAKSDTLTLLLSLTTLAAESTLWVVIFFKRSRKFIIPMVLLFHTGVWFLMRLNFLRLFSLVYLAYIDYEFFYFKIRNTFNLWRLPSKTSSLPLQNG